MIIILFFEKCIEKGICLDEIISKLWGPKESRIENVKWKSPVFGKVDESRVRWDDFMFWNYRNVLNLALTRKKMLAQEKSWEFEWKEVVSLCLSGWVLNGIMHIWLVKKMIEKSEKWLKVKLITWYSIWATIGTILAFILTGDKENDLKAIAQLETYMYDWIIKRKDEFNDSDLKKFHTDRTAFIRTEKKKWRKENDINFKQEFDDKYEWVKFKLEWDLMNSKEDADSIHQFFLKVADRFGITSESQLKDAKIPVLVWATRRYGESSKSKKVGEQEMILGHNDAAILSVEASSNINGQFGKFAIDGYVAEDWGENMSWIMTRPLGKLWVNPQEVVISDVWFSWARNGTKEMLSRATWWAPLSKKRQHTGNSVERDYGWKFLYKNLGAKVYDIAYPSVEEASFEETRSSFNPKKYIKWKKVMWKWSNAGWRVNSEIARASVLDGYNAEAMINPRVLHMGEPEKLLGRVAHDWSPDFSQYTEDKHTDGDNDNSLRIMLRKAA